MSECSGYIDASDCAAIANRFGGDRIPRWGGGGGNWKNKQGWNKWGKQDGKGNWNNYNKGRNGGFENRSYYGESSFRSKSGESWNPAEKFKRHMDRGGKSGGGQQYSVECMNYFGELFTSDIIMDDLDR